jgi:hypothetical protein
MANQFNNSAPGANIARPEPTQDELIGLGIETPEISLKESQQLFKDEKIARQAEFKSPLYQDL